jgi:hypothetical protein
MWLSVMFFFAFSYYGGLMCCFFMFCILVECLLQPFRFRLCSIVINGLAFEVCLCFLVSFEAMSQCSEPYVLGEFASSVFAGVWV